MWTEIPKMYVQSNKTLESCKLVEIFEKGSFCDIYKLDEIFLAFTWLLKTLSRDFYEVVPLIFQGI